MRPLCPIGAGNSTPPLIVLSIITQEWRDQVNGLTFRLIVSGRMMVKEWRGGGRGRGEIREGEREGG